MDTCKKVRELILIDDRENLEDVRFVEEHIQQCESCRLLYTQVLKQSVMLMNDNRNFELSADAVWQKIEEELDQRQSVSLTEFNILSEIERWMGGVRPALTGILGVVVLLVGIVGFWNRSSDTVVVQSPVQDSQVTVSIEEGSMESEVYMAHLFPADVSYKDFGTSLEQYFL